MTFGCHCSSNNLNFLPKLIASYCIWIIPPSALLALRAISAPGASGSEFRRCGQQHRRCSMECTSAPAHTPLETEQKAVNMTKIASRMLAGITVPDTPLVGRTIEYARQKCEPYLFNHVVRSWLFAARIGQLQNTEYDAEVVAVGTLLHDITLNESFAGPRRFEV